jgi:hypothetical protein
MDLVPLISGSSTGPLGLVHLPRFWLKMRAYAVDVLPEGYRHGSGGTDEALLDAIGLDGDAFAAFIAREEPDYQYCEAWVSAHAADTTPATIAAFNRHWLTFEMPDPRRTEWCERFALSGSAYTRSIGLNQLDDWAGVYQELIGCEEPGEPGEPVEPVVPAISSSVAGPLGVPHLPRLWLKHLLHSLGRLPAGYRHGPGGFDEMLTDALGLDRDAFAAYVETEKPEYLPAESWVRANATTLTPETIAAFDARIRSTNLPEEQAIERRAELGIADPEFKLGIPLNDLDDWASLHRQLQAAAR